MKKRDKENQSYPFEMIFKPIETFQKRDYA